MDFSRNLILTIKKSMGNCLAQKTQKIFSGGPTGSRTQVAGFKVQSANHYTIEPSHSEISHTIIPNKTINKLLPLFTKEIQTSTGIITVKLNHSIIYNNNNN
jgi:hypothetical protein